MVIPLLTGILFGFLASLHIYWALGGKWASRKTIPVRPDGAPLFQPGKMATLLVALLLGLSAAYFLTGWGRVHDFSDFWSIPAWIIVAAFFLRSIGEFKYVGFFKRIRGSDFARMDTFVYSPLCLLISGGVAHFMVFLLR
ncbi:MAG: hypothetical protein CMF59_12270 [Leptospiraceae bacterium]|nr:hypothetical protein [Leptospiraceae bacterium]